jgi:hypothetical protein
MFVFALHVFKFLPNLSLWTFYYFSWSLWIIFTNFIDLKEHILGFIDFTLLFSQFYFISPLTFIVYLFCLLLSLKFLKLIGTLSLVWDPLFIYLFVLKIRAFNTIHIFPLYFISCISHITICCVFIFIWFKIFPDFPMIFYLAYMLFKNVLFNYKIYVYFPNILLLFISKFPCDYRIQLG